MGRRILVTGASGFVGAHLCAAFAQAGCSVTALVREDSDVSGLEALAARVAVTRCEQTYESIRGAVQASGAECIVHTASLFLSDHSSEQIQALIGANILFGNWLLEAAHQSGIRYLVNAGTSWQHCGEGEIHPANLYAATKQAFEAIIDYYCTVKGLSAVTLKLFDTYGPGDRRRKLIPLLLDAMRRNQPLELSPGEQILDLLYIEDVCSAFAGAVELCTRGGRQHQTYTLRSGNRYPLRELVTLLEELSGRSGFAALGKRPYREREIMNPWAGGAVLPNWGPRYTLRDGLRKVLADAGLSP